MMETPWFVKEILYNDEQIQNASYRIAHQIKEFYDGYIEDIIVIVIMNGGKYFSDMIFRDERLRGDERFKFIYIQTKSYINNKKQEDDELVTTINDKDIIKIDGKRILIIDDIYDTGNTLDKVNKLIKDFGATSIENIVMIERRYHKYDIPILVYGFKVDNDDFLVGCGLDYNDGYRDLPYIASIKKDGESC